MCLLFRLGFCPIWEFRVWTFILLSLTFCTPNEYLAGREHIVGGRIGEDVYLPCDVDLRMCGKIYFITWTKNSTKDWDRVYLFSDAYEKSMGFLSEPDRASFTLQQSSAYLRIKSLSIDDEGTYKCDVTYIQGKCPSLSYVHLYVVVEPGEPYLEVDKEKIPNGTTIGPYYESSTLLLHCRLPGGRPVPSIRWWNGTNPMPYKVGIKTNSDWTYDVTSTMRFVISRYDLGARFECVIENNVTRTYHSMWIRLDIFVRPRSISLRGPTTQVVAGEMVSLTCSVDGARPSANVTWYNRTEIIKPQPPSNRDLMSDGTYRTTSTLVFVASRHDHARDFFCKGTNQVLLKKHEAPLLQALRLEVLYPPSVFLRPEGILTILEHDAANITCSYDANPPNITEIFWYRDSLPLQSRSTNVAKNLAKRGSRTHLIFKNISRQDAGTYSCHVRNAFGRANSTNQLQINVIYPPSVEVVISPDTFTEGIDQTVRILCTVENGNPAKLEDVRWFFNDIPVNQTLSEAEIKLDGVQRHFRGRYSCQGRNAAGWSVVSVAKSLSVRYVPGPAVVKQDGQMAIKGKPVTLLCQLEDPGFPAASLYRWERNGLLLKNCTSATCVTGPAGVTTQGNYTCAAINEVGGGRPGLLSLKVQAPPQFLNKPPPISGALRNATHVSLVCHVECQPLCEVYWLHNNQHLKESKDFVQTNKRHDANSARISSFPSVISSLSWSMSSLSSNQLDNSSFSCHSTGNEAGPGVQSATQFRVEYPPEHIRIPAVEIMLKEGEVADELLCSASAHPMGQYMWIMGDKIVSRSPSLFINSSVSRAMGGRYTCIVTNQHGKAEAELKITVLHKPDCLLKKEYDSNGNALLSCAATGEPPVFNFTWQKNNVTMEEIAGLGFETISRYVVSRDRHENSYGVYSCTVTNAIGTSEVCSIQVDSLPSPAGWVQLLLQEESMIIVACVVGGVAVSGILVIVTFLIVLMRRRVRAVNGCSIGERQSSETREQNTEHVLNGKTAGNIAEKRDWTPLLNDHDENGWKKRPPLDTPPARYKEFKLREQQVR